MSFEKRRISAKSFPKSQFNWFLLTWMLHSRNVNKKINRLYEWDLIIVYTDYMSYFKTFLKRMALFPSIIEILKMLAVEINKFLHDISPTIIGNVLKLHSPATYTLRTRK